MRSKPRFTVKQVRVPALRNARRVVMAALAIVVSLSTLHIASGQASAHGLSYASDCRVSKVTKGRDYRFFLDMNCLNVDGQRRFSRVWATAGLSEYGLMGDTKGVHRWGLWRCNGATNIRTWNNVQSGYNGAYIDFDCQAPNGGKYVLNTYLVTWQVGDDGIAINNSASWERFEALFR